MKFCFRRAFILIIVLQWRGVDFLKRGIFVSCGRRVNEGLTRFSVRRSSLEGVLSQSERWTRSDPHAVSDAWRLVIVEDKVVLFKEWLIHRNLVWGLYVEIHFFLLGVWCRSLREASYSFQVVISSVHAKAALLAWCLRVNSSWKGKLLRRRAF